MMPEPRLSVIMPARNVNPAPMLDSLLTIHVPLEIIIVDDCSEDDTVERILAWTSSSGQPVKLIRNQKRLYSYGSRLKGMAHASAPFVWNVDADDIIPENALVEMAFQQMECWLPDILHCRAMGVEHGNSLQKILPWSEPFTATLSGSDIFSLFMRESYPPAILWNKFFSLELCRKICEIAPDLEIRYFDVKFLGLLSILLAETYRASNYLVYQYRMRKTRSSSLYASQVRSLLLLNDKLSPIIAKINKSSLSDFQSFCLRRLTIQTGHLSIMFCHELSGKPEINPQDWLNRQLLVNIELPDLIKALFLSCRINQKKLSHLAAILSGNEFKMEITGKKTRLEKFISENSGSIGYTDALNVNLDYPNACEPSPTLALALIKINALMARRLTQLLAPGIDITKKAN